SQTAQARSNTMTEVTVDAAGGIELPEEIRRGSGGQPGARLVVLAREGRIVLLGGERFWQRGGKPAQGVLEAFRLALARDPQMPFFGGLTLEEYGALSDEAEQALWDRLTMEAERKTGGGERDIPSHFRPAR